MDTTWIGITICFVGSFLGALGDKLVHDSYIKEDAKKKKKHMSQMTMWLFGTLLSVVIDPILTICSLYFTSAALVAPFAGVHILWNLIITNISLKIRTKLHQYMGSFFLICGIALIIIFSEKKVDIHNMNDLATLYSQTKVIIYLVLTFTIILTLLIVCLLPFLFKDIKNVSSKNEQLLYINKFVANTCTRSCEISVFTKIDTRAKISGTATSFKSGKGGDYPNGNSMEHPLQYPLKRTHDHLIVHNRSDKGNNYAPHPNDGIITSSQVEKCTLKRHTKVGKKTNNAGRRNTLMNYRPSGSFPRLPANHTLPKHPTEKIKKINFKSSKTQKKRHSPQFRKSKSSWDGQKGYVRRTLHRKYPRVNRKNSDVLGKKSSKWIELREDLYRGENIPQQSKVNESNKSYQSGSHTTSCSKAEPIIEPIADAHCTSTHKKKKKKNLLISHNKSITMIKKIFQNKDKPKLKACKKKQKSFRRYTNAHKQNDGTVEDPPELSPQSSHPSSIAGNESFSPIDVLKGTDKMDSCENWKNVEPFSLMVYSPTRERGSPGKASVANSREGRSSSSNRGGRSDPVQLQYLALIASIYPAEAKSSRIRHPEILYRICCCTLCGMSGGFVNIFSEQIIGIFSKEKFHMFTHPFAYVLIMLTIFCLCNQLFFLNISLSKFSVTSVIPLIMSNIVFFSSLTTIIMREEQSVIHSTNAVFFSLGVLLVIIGILYLQYNINRILLRFFKPKKGLSIGVPPFHIYTKRKLPWSIFSAEEDQTQIINDDSGSCIGRQATHTNLGRKKTKKKKNAIHISGNDLFEYFATLTNEEDKMNEEKKKKNKTYSVTYIQKLPKKNLLLKRWKYDLYEKIKEKMKRDYEIMSRTKVCRRKYKLPVDFFKLGDQVRGKIVQVENHLIKLDVNAINFAHLYIKRYFEDKAQLGKKYQVGKHIDVVICYIHKKNGIIQVTDNEEEIKALRRSLQKLRDAGFLPSRTGEGANGTAGEATNRTAISTDNWTVDDARNESVAELPEGPAEDLTPDHTHHDNTANRGDPPEQVKKKLGVDFRTNEEEQDLMYIKEESPSNRKKNITHFKIEDTVSGVVQYINEEGAYINIGCNTLAFLNLGHYNRDPRTLIKDVKKKKISIGDYLKNLKVRKIDVLSNRIEVTLYNPEEEACLRILNQQETVKEQNKYMPCPSYVTQNYHMINYLKKFNELKRQKKKNIHNLFDKKEQLNELKNISHLKKSQFAPFMMRYNELTSPNTNYQDMLEQHADNEQFLKEIGALPSQDDEQKEEHFSLESLKKQNKALKDEIERYRDRSSSNTHNTDEDSSHEMEEAPFRSNEMMQQNLNKFFMNNVNDWDDESMDKCSTGRNTDRWEEEDQTIPMEDDSDDFFRLYHERANQKLRNKRDDSVQDGNKQTLMYLKDNIHKIKENVLSEGRKKTDVKAKIGDKVNSTSVQASNEMLHRWNQVLTGDSHKRESATYDGMGERKDSAKGGQPDWARYLEEAEEDDDIDESDDEGQTPGQYPHGHQGKDKPTDLYYINEKEKKKKLKRRNIFRDDEQVQEDLSMGEDPSSYSDNHRDKFGGDFTHGRDDIGDGIQRSDEQSIDREQSSDGDEGDDAAGERSFFNVKKELKYIFSQNLSMTLPKDEQKCIEEASKLFGDDINTWNEKMYYYFGDRDQVPLDGFDIYEQDEFRNNLVDQGVQEFSEYHKLLDEQQFDVTSERDFLAATYGAATGGAPVSGPNECGPNESGPNESGPNESGPNESGPNESGPNESGPDEKGKTGNGLTGADPVNEGTNEGTNERGGTSTTQQAKMSEALMEDDLENYLSTFVDEEAEKTQQDDLTNELQNPPYKEPHAKKHTQNCVPDLHPPELNLKGEKTDVGKRTDERSTTWRDNIKSVDCLNNGGTPQPSGYVEMDKGDSTEGANSPNEKEINVEDIVNKAINIGNLFRRKELAKLMQRKKTQECETEGGAAHAGGEKFPRGGDEQYSCPQGLVKDPATKPFLRVSKIVKQGEKEEIAPLDVKEGEHQDQNGMSNVQEDALGSSVQEDHDELKPYRHASYEVLGYYKRKRKMRNFHDLEEVDAGNEEDVVLKDEDLLGKSTEDTGSEDKNDSLEEKKKKEHLNLDRQMDLLFLHGQEDKLTGGNYVEKLLGEEKYKNKNANKEIDFLIQNYKYVNEHPDELIQDFYKNKEVETNKNMDLSNGGITNVVKEPNGQVENRQRGITNDGVYETEKGKKLPTTKNSVREKTHTAQSTHFNIKQTHGIETEANHMSDESLALRSLSLKLGLLKEKHMHLDDKSLINLFVRNKKFRRALKSYGIKNVKNISIPLIYKITKMLYFERPFPRKEQTRKLNMD
ncbi:hypothetical protein AK88_00735 [Plasmodium fragile]|uniref:S1 motif domain-containing protein n=1 Tax=Plasmodium fragile TaxID=5857 RepID=A0A0D9QR26_PLAFR|nr:uncharacterized protein AK88_00735 [Plasmodium fragile]KJP89524.1 hypothetical protein AK88_00735 [Plasmodium fragile]